MRVVEGEGRGTGGAGGARNLINSTVCECLPWSGAPLEGQTALVGLGEEEGGKEKEDERREREGALGNRQPHSRCGKLLISKLEEVLGANAVPERLDHTP